MTIEYDLEADDVIEFNLFHHQNSPATQRIVRNGIILRVVIWCVLSVGLWQFAVRRGFDLVTGAIFVSPFAALALCSVALHPWQHRRGIRKIVERMYREGTNRGLFGRRTIELSPERIVETTEFGETVQNWNAVERIVQDANHVFIYVTAVSAFIVPRRAFLHDWDFDDFVETARRFHQQAGGAVPADVASG